MKKKTILFVVCAVLVFFIGFFLGQEYTKYKLKKTILDAFGGIEDVFTDDSDVSDSSSKTIKEKNNVETRNDVVDEFVSLKKGTTENVKGNWEGEDLEVELSLTDVVFNNEILPPEPTASYYTYFPEKEGKTYAIAYMTIKNLEGTKFDITDVLRNLYDSSCSSKAIFGGKYEYTVDVIAEIEKDNNGKFDFETSFIYLDPLETKNIIVAYSVPDEVKNMDADLNICLGNKKIVLDFVDEVQMEDVQQENE